MYTIYLGREVNFFGKITLLNGLGFLLLILNQSYISLLIIHWQGRKVQLQADQDPRCHSILFLFYPYFVCDLSYLAAKQRNQPFFKLCNIIEELLAGFSFLSPEESIFNQELSLPH
jgi:hypothetical protein